MVHGVIQEIKNGQLLDSSMMIVLLEELWTIFHMLLMAAMCSVLNCFSLMEEYKKAIFALLQVHNSRVVIVTVSIYWASTLCWVLYVYTFSQILTSSLQSRNNCPRFLTWGNRLRELNSLQKGAQRRSAHRAGSPCCFQSSHPSTKTRSQTERC